MYKNVAYSKTGNLFCIEYSSNHQFMLPLVKVGYVIYFVSRFSALVFKHVYSVWARYFVVDKLLFIYFISALQAKPNNGERRGVRPLLGAQVIAASIT